MNLSKNQTISLVKGIDERFSVLRFGVNWGMIGGKREVTKRKLFFFKKTEIVEERTKCVDLDAAAFCYDENNEFVEDCFTNLLGGKLDIGYLKHSGDDTRGDSVSDDSDNETISVFINNIPSNINSIVFTVNSFSGEKFNEIPNVGIRIYEGEVDIPTRVRATFDLHNDNSFNNTKAVIIGKLFRVGGGWDFKAIGATYEKANINSLRKVCKLYV